MANYPAAGCQAISRIDFSRTQSNSSIPRRRRYHQNVLLGAAPVGDFMDVSTPRIVRSVVWSVALWASDRFLGMWAKRMWFIVLLVGFWWGSCLYRYFVYLPQVFRSTSAEA
jgi:hypothetical protein